MDGFPSEGCDGWEGREPSPPLLSYLSPQEDTIPYYSDSGRIEMSTESVPVPASDRVRVAVESSPSHATHPSPIHTQCPTASLKADSPLHTPPTAFHPPASPSSVRSLRLTPSPTPITLEEMDGFVVNHRTDINVSGADSTIPPALLSLSSHSSSDPFLSQAAKSQMEESDLHITSFQRPLPPAFLSPSSHLPPPPTEAPPKTPETPQGTGPPGSLGLSGAPAPSPLRSPSDFHPGPILYDADSAGMLQDIDYTQDQLNACYTNQVEDGELREVLRDLGCPILAQDESDLGLDLGDIHPFPSLAASPLPGGLAGETNQRQGFLCTYKPHTSPISPTDIDSMRREKDVGCIDAGIGESGKVGASAEVKGVEEGVCKPPAKSDVSKPQSKSKAPSNKRWAPQPPPSQIKRRPSNPEFKGLQWQERRPLAPISQERQPLARDRGWGQNWAPPQQPISPFTQGQGWGQSWTTPQTRREHPLLTAPHRLNSHPRYPQPPPTRPPPPPPLFGMTTFNPMTGIYARPAF